MTGPRQVSHLVAVIGPDRIVPVVGCQLSDKHSPKPPYPAYLLRHGAWKADSQSASSTSKDRNREAQPPRTHPHTPRSGFHKVHVLRAVHGRHWHPPTDPSTYIPHHGSTARPWALALCRPSTASYKEQPLSVTCSSLQPERFFPRYWSWTRPRRFCSTAVHYRCFTRLLHI